MTTRVSLSRKCVCYSWTSQCSILGAVKVPLILLFMVSIASSFFLLLFCCCCFFFYQPNNPERRKVTDEVYYNVSTSQIINTTSSVWSRFKGINQFEISKDLSRLLKQSRSLNIYQAKTKLRVHSTLFKTEKGTVFITSNCQKGHKEKVHTWWLQLSRLLVCLFVFYISISVSLNRIPISARSASHASYTVLRILSLWGYSFPTTCVLPRQNHPSADYCQSHRYQWQDLCPRCCCVMDWRCDLRTIHCVCNGGWFQWAQVTC